MRIVLAGIIGRYPWGGVTWCSLMYLLGLRKLGHEVFYLEDTCECNYDPDLNTIATDSGYALRQIDSSLRPFGLGESWCYVDYKGRHHGMEERALREVCRTADLFLVLSGGCWAWREHYAAIPRKAFIDSDPAFTQLALDKALREAPDNPKARWYVDFFRGYDCLFTFGSNIGTPRSDLPTAGMTWHHTWQPVCTDLWRPEASPLPPRDVWTTVMTWRIKSFKDIGGNKDQEFLSVLDLARRCEGNVRFELAVNGPRDLLAGHGWPCVDAMAMSRDLWRYHAYIASSRGEFSVAKHTYVATNSGWFSDRTQCYLACGKPAVVQDTGFGATLPVGEGLLAWRTIEDAREALLEAESNYARHAKKARELSTEFFEASKILENVISRTASA